jgi:hypothetical protein
MSTRINVTVGDGGLLDRNAQQTAANRQAKLLADQRAAAETLGVERRAADRTAAGLDPLTGLPASTPSSASTINRLDQEPAANRRGIPVNLGHGWEFGEGFDSFPEEGVAITRIFSQQVLAGEKMVTLPLDPLNRSSKRYLGAGNGSQWTEITEANVPPPYPADDFEVEATAVSIDEEAFVEAGYRTSAELRDANRSAYIILPAGRGLFVYVYAYASCWTLMTRRALSRRIWKVLSGGSLARSDPPFLGASPEVMFDYEADFADATGGYYVGISVLNELPRILSFGTESDSFYTVKAFVGGSGFIRELSAVPSPMRQIMELAVPPPQVTTSTFQVRGWFRPAAGGVGEFDSRQLEDLPAIVLPAPQVFLPDAGFNSVGLSAERLTGVTPNLFALLNQQFQFTDPANIKAPPENLKWVLDDYTKGGYKALYDDFNLSLNDVYNQAEFFAYAQQKAPTPPPFRPNDFLEQPLLERRVPSATLRMAPDREAKSPDPGANLDFFPTQNFYGAWDWGDPAYCRRMLADLGFTEADLSPTDPSP